MACPIAFFGWARYLAPKAKVTRSNRVGCASFFLFYSAICALGLKLQVCLVRVSKQNLKKNRHRMRIARRRWLEAHLSRNSDRFHKRSDWRSQAAVLEF